MKHDVPAPGGSTALDEGRAAAPSLGFAAPRRSHVQSSLFALHATEEEIRLPKFQPLGYLEQSRLIRSAQQGNEDAKKQVWLQNARLVYRVLNRVRMPAQHVADAFQEGQFAIERAILRFDVDRLLEFSTYAYKAVLNRVVRFRMIRTHATRLPAPVAPDYHRFRREVIDADSRAAWFDARDRWLDRSPALYERLVRIHVIACPEDITRDCACAAASDEPPAQLQATEVHDVVMRAIEVLSERERDVIRRRYGLAGEREETLVGIGDSFGLTKERIRQIQVKAEAKLRDALVDRNYEDPPRPEQLAVADRLCGLDLQVPASSAPPILVQHPPPPITIRPHEFSAREPLLFDL